MRLEVCLNYIFFIFTTIVVAMVLSVIITEHSGENIGIGAFYDEKPNSIDAVIVGPSTAYTTLLPPIAFRKHGITTAVYSIPLMKTEHYIPIVKDIIKYQKPKVIFLNVDSMLPFISRSDDLKFALKSIAYIKPSLNKIKIIQEFKNCYKLTCIEIFEYYFPIIRFHSEWKKLSINAIKRNSNKHKGAVIGFAEFYKEKLDFNKYKKEQEENRRNAVKKAQKNKVFLENLQIEKRKERNIEIYNREIEFWEYIKNLHDLFLYISSFDEDIKVVLIQVPLPLPLEEINRDKSNYFINIFNIANRYGIDSVYINNSDKLRIDANNDFLDADHLNFWGAVKATDYLSKLLVEKYGLKDKRNDVKYNSWNEEYEFYRNEIKRRYNIDIESGELSNSEINN